ncbi:ROK family transcriptional regulator [Citreimonas salinaria]|uniref:ROK family transcriptional regulator n=1 Tax=Citreimonas salinaria TaxID=321339 RepID=UPI001FE19F2E|nr:ROK family transcriptional regulator [Citreimonas salinaria]
MTLPAGPAGRPLRQQAFEHIRANGLISRADVAKDLGVSPGSVTAVVAELIDLGMIQEHPRPRRSADSGRGRPPVALGVRPGAGAVAGLKLSDRAHSAVVIDASGRRLGEAVIEAEPGRHRVETLIDGAEAALKMALEQAGLAATDLAATGLGLPGVVAHEAGRVLWSPLMHERDVPFAEQLADRIGGLVCIDNDANLVTLAELWFGAGRHMSDFAVVTIEHGVGMGLVLNHRLFRGAQGLGMELGHTKVQPDGALCRCGQRGCLEAYVADYALVREASTALNWPDAGLRSTPVILESLYAHAKAGNSEARAIFGRAGRYLSIGLANVVNLFDPGLILLSGERMQYDYLYAEEVLAEMTALTLTHGRNDPKVEIHAWGDLLWAQGAAALALDMATPILLNGGAVR